MSNPLGNSVAALIAHGTDSDRAIAVALAEAGADVAIATEWPEQSQEFATASIANEIWAIGRKSSVVKIEGSDASSFGSAVAGVMQELGRADLVVRVDAILSG